MLDGPGEAEQTAAACALANIGSNKALEALRLRIQERYLNEQVRNTTIELLGNFGAESVKLLYFYLRARDKYFASNARISLQKVLKSNSASLPTSFLKELSQLEDFSILKSDHFGDYGELRTWSEHIDCSIIRN
jgi:HEAT repeat protein